MMRHCDGNDPNLLTWSDRTLTGVPMPTRVPCSCGLTFDDVERLTIFPHLPIGPKPTPEQVDRILAELATAPGVSPATVIRHAPHPSLCLEEVTTAVGIQAQPILHVCTRYADHVPDRKHICSCQFTWGNGS